MTRFRRAFNLCVTAGSMESGAQADRPQRERFLSVDDGLEGSESLIH